MLIKCKSWWTRKMRAFCWKWKRKYKTIIWLGLLLLLFSIIYFWLTSDSADKQSHLQYGCASIDVVYTWVNGSDPVFLQSLKAHNSQIDESRYDDKNELKYSLRSLEKFAPWVRHVYIVTNGQIPHWLDLSYEKVSVVPHKLLMPAQLQQYLPTFSSAAIETFLHHIPNLSKRFLYMNDDIFLGERLYPEDLYTQSEGVKIYPAWLVPDCAEDCPWTYIGDGACDRHCNIEQCQFDGGDCNAGIAAKSAADAAAAATASFEQKSNAQQNMQQQVQKHKTNHSSMIRKFPLRKKYRSAKALLASSRNLTLYSAKTSSFKQHLMHFQQAANQSMLNNELQKLVSAYNNAHLNSHADKTVADSTTAAYAQLRFNSPSPSSSNSINGSYYSTKDIYSQSLIFSNMLLNSVYGFKARNVLAHVGFLLDRDIIVDMQNKFFLEIAQTVSHRFRSPQDLQFAFTYYSFLMSEQQQLSVAEIFDEFDTDNSHTWSDREVRTFLASMYPLPLDWSAVRFFEEVIGNCSRQWKQSGASAAHREELIYSTLVYERYEDSNVPTITRELVENCPLLAEALVENFGNRAKYKYALNPKRNVNSNFMMLTSNVTEVVDSLDKMRRTPRKFNCINDNLEPQYIDDNQLIRHLLEDFYLSFFPKPSRFELHSNYRNRFTNWHDYQKWRRRKRGALIIGYGVTLILIIILARFLCMHKAKIVRRCIQNM